MKAHIQAKRREYKRLFQRAKEFGVSWAEFRYQTVMIANEVMFDLEKNGQKCNWADECLNAAESFVYEGEQMLGEQEVEREYEESLENQGEVIDIFQYR